MLDAWKLALEALIYGQPSPRRTSDAQRVLIVTQGMASQDVALAHLVYKRALEKRLGQPMLAALPQD
jgi:ornithine cyclodeaminase/alanine dehydrogenase-like protein (mu-crystallin family)